MSELKHAPGPWEVKHGKYCMYVECAKGYPVTSDGRPDVEANLRLIAAAPELLEALEPFANLTVEGMPVDDATYPAFAARIAAARAAIAKATGGEG